MKVLLKVARFFKSFDWFDGARFCYEIAEHKGSMRAKYHLAEFYLFGHGVPLDAEKVKALLGEAEPNYPPAGKLLEKIGSTVKSQESLEQAAEGSAQILGALESAVGFSIRPNPWRLMHLLAGLVLVGLGLYLTTTEIAGFGVLVLFAGLYGLHLAVMS